MKADLSEWLDPSPWLRQASETDPRLAERAMLSDAPGPGELAALLSPAADGLLEPMAQRARTLTQRHFGRTIQLYVPLYLSSHCSGGCVYCGFAADRRIPRHRLGPDEVAAELGALKAMGFEEVLLLTGERMPEVDFAYVLESVRTAAGLFHTVSVEAFPMTAQEYGELADAGCTSVTLYQETYDPARYAEVHRWGPKKNYAQRLSAPERALGAGIRMFGMGVLLGLSEPVADLLSLYLHARHLQRRYWRAGLSVSFPRIQPQTGGYEPPFPVHERFLARAVFALRICLPDVHLVLSTRENPGFRDGMAGIGISKMSVASRTTVGGYGGEAAGPEDQFEVSDHRDVPAFCAMLAAKGLQPVFKNWDRTYRSVAGDARVSHAGGRA
jgi:2-iminoacetate synthase